MNAFPITCVFSLNPLGRDGKEVPHKAICCIFGDHQIAEVDYDPIRTYDPVACHEAVCILLLEATANDLIVKGRDFSRAFLYRNTRNEVYIEQPTPSTGVEERPGTSAYSRNPCMGLAKLVKSRDHYSLNFYLNGVSNRIGPIACVVSLEGLELYHIVHCGGRPCICTKCSLATSCLKGKILVCTRRKVL